MEAMTLKVVLTTWTRVKCVLPNLIESSIWLKKSLMGRLTAYGAFILSLLASRSDGLILA